MNERTLLIIHLEVIRDGSIHQRCLPTPLTKAMSGERLVQTLATGQLDLRPTAESLIIKEKNRRLRKEKKVKDKEAEE